MKKKIAIVFCVFVLILLSSCSGMLKAKNVDDTTDYEE